MWDVRACRGCLTVKCKLEKMGEASKRLYTVLTGLQIKDGDGYPNYFCVECRTQLRKCLAFRRKSRRAHFVLKEIMTVRKQVTYSDIITVNRRKTNLESPLKFWDPQKTSSYLIINADEQDSFTEVKPTGLTYGANYTHIVDIKPAIVKTEEVDIPAENIDDITEDNSTPDQIDEPKEEAPAEIDLNDIFKDLNDDNDSSENEEVEIKNDVKAKDEKEVKHMLDKRLPLNAMVNAVAASTIRVLSLEEQIKKIEVRQKQEPFYHAQYKCSMCFTTYKSMEQLVEHVNFHNERRFAHECQVCKNKFETVDDLNIHIARTHMYEYTCKCQAVYYSMYDIVIHHRRCYQRQARKNNTIVNWPKMFKKKLLTQEMRWQMAARRAADPEKQEFEPSSPTDIQCDVCGVWVASFISMQAHIRTAHSFSYTCRVCKEVLSHRSLCSKHAHTHLQNRIWPCKICGTQYKSSIALTAHRARKHGIQMPCNLCGRSFPTPWSLYRHQLTQHKYISLNDPLVGDPQHQCTDCKAQFLNRAALEVHLVMEDHTGAGDVPFSCIPCKKVYECAEQLETHLITCKQPVKYPRKCCYCEVMLVDKAHYKRHYTQDHPTLQYRYAGMNTICESCGKSIFKPHLEAHLKSHQESAYECRCCGAASLDPTVHVNHVLSQHAARPFCCTLCTRRFQQRSDCRDHILKVDHTPRVAGPARNCSECRCCGAASLDPTVHVNHVLSQHAARPFCCTLCTRRFQQRSDCRDHILKVDHTPRVAGPARNCSECRCCGAASLDPTVHVNHVLSQHAARPFCCTLCTRRFQQRSDCRDHILKVDHTPRVAGPARNCSECRCCGAASLDPTVHVNHVLSQHAARPFCCTLCTRRFQQRSDCRDHILKVDHTPRVAGPARNCSECRCCGAASLDPTVHVNHVLSQHAARPFCCTLCTRRFQQRSDCRDHILKVDHTPRVAGPARNCSECRCCGAASLDPTVHVNHVLSQHAARPFCCTLCTRRFQQRSDCRDHILKVDHTPRVAGPARNCSECRCCGAASLDPTVHVNHVLSQHAARPFCCTLCTRRFQQRSDCRDHILKVDHTPRVAGPARNCSECRCCGAASLDPTVHVNHVLSQHAARPFCCTLCTRRFQQRSDCRDHILKVDHTPRVAGPARNCSECRCCGAASLDPTVHVNHVLSQHAARPFCCTLCTRRFQQRSDCRDHILKVDHTPRVAGPPRNCSECRCCGAASLDPTVHVNHVLSQHAARPFCCTLCTRRFQQRSDCRDHILKVDHTPRVAGPARNCSECRCCGAASLDPTVHVNHVLSQHAARPFCCTLCTRRFQQRSDCRDHILKVHAPAKLYRCEFCGLEFSYFRRLKDHSEKLHNLVLPNLRIPKATKLKIFVYAHMMIEINILEKEAVEKSEVELLDYLGQKSKPVDYEKFFRFHSQPYEIVIKKRIRKPRPKNSKQSNINIVSDVVVKREDDDFTDGDIQAKSEPVARVEVELLGTEVGISVKEIQPQIEDEVVEEMVEESMEQVVFDQDPVEEVMFDQESEEHVLLDEESVQQMVSDQEPIEQVVSDQELVEQKVFYREPVEQRVFHQKPVEQKVFHQKPVEQKVFHQKPVEQKVFHKKTVEQKVFQQEPVEQDQEFVDIKVFDQDLGCQDVEQEPVQQPMEVEEAPLEVFEMDGQQYVMIGGEMYKIAGEDDD